MNNDSLTEKERERLFLLGHIPNVLKTDAEFKEWCDFSKKLDFSTPKRDSKVRSLHEMK